MTAINHLNSSRNAWEYDVAVIGGGPGGSSVATMLAKTGRRVLVLEKEPSPRFHIGESQLPWTNPILKTLGVYDTMVAEGFVRKWGASFWTIDGRDERYADFAQAVETPMPETFQVPRQRFDQLLLEHSEKSGATVLKGCRALAAEFDSEGATLDFSEPDGAKRSVRAGFVVDASGRSGFLAKTHGRHEMDPILRNISVYAHFEGIPRNEGRRAGDIRMLTRADMGWIWLIPISPDVISVGAVIPQSVYKTEARATPEETLQHFIQTTGGSGPLFEGARQVSPARFEADFSYLGTKVAGDRWLAVGDAAAFLDPIFSTGVLLAMQAGLDAAREIDRALEDGKPSAARFDGYAAEVRRRFHHFRRFVVGFYDPNFRDLWYTPSSRFGLYQAILSVLAGNFRPTLATRLRIRLFFMLVALQRFVPIAPRTVRPETVRATAG